MAIPKQVHSEQKKKKTAWDKMRNSAIFVLFMVIVFTALIVYIIVGISSLLSQGKWPSWPF